MPAEMPETHRRVTIIETLQLRTVTLVDEVQNHRIVSSVADSVSIQMQYS